MIDPELTNLSVNLSARQSESLDVPAYQVAEKLVIEMNNAFGTSKDASAVLSLLFLKYSRKSPKSNWPANQPRLTTTSNSAMPPLVPR